MALAIVGILLGVLLGITGGGGSIIITPLLIYSVGYSFAEASKFALLAVFISSSIGSVLHYKDIQWRISGLFVAIGSIASFIGLELSKFFTEQTLKTTFAILLLVVAGIIIKKAISSLKKSLLKTLATSNYKTNQNFLKLSSVAFITGIAVGFFGVGGGFLIVPALNFFTKLSAHAIRTNALLIMALMALINLTIIIFNSYPTSLNFAELGMFVFFSIIGLMLGVMLEKKISSNYVSLVFGGMCIMAAIFIFYNEYSFLNP